MSFFTDNYQWIVLVILSFSGLITAIIGIILRRKKQPKFKVHYIMDPVVIQDQKKSSPDICRVPIRFRIINVGNYQTVTKIIFKIKFDKLDDQDKKIIAEYYTYLDQGLELGKEHTMTDNLYPHINATNWEEAEITIFAKYKKTFGREVTRKIAYKKFKNN